MTIDEAIQRENKIVEENQKIVDTEIVFDGVSLSQLYCDDIEVIEEHLENYKKCVEYHKQLAEWLEELKFIKQWKSDIMEDFCRYDVSSFEELVTNVRTKAIDDFLKEADATFTMQSDGTAVLRRLEKIADRLKGGGYCE